MHLEGGGAEAATADQSAAHADFRRKFAAAVAGSAEFESKQQKDQKALRRSPDAG
jgi:hypothetical protein